MQPCTIRLVPKLGRQTDIGCAAQFSLLPTPCLMPVLSGTIIIDESRY